MEPKSCYFCTAKLTHDKPQACPKCWNEFIKEYVGLLSVAGKLDLPNRVKV